MKYHTITAALVCLVSAITAQARQNIQNSTPQNLAKNAASWGVPSRTKPALMVYFDTPSPLFVAAFAAYKCTDTPKWRKVIANDGTTTKDTIEAIYCGSALSGIATSFTPEEYLDFASTHNLIVADTNDKIPRFSIWKEPQYIRNQQERSIFINALTENANRASNRASTPTTALQGSPTASDITNLHAEYVAKHNYEYSHIRGGTTSFSTPTTGLLAYQERTVKNLHCSKSSNGFSCRYTLETRFIPSNKLYEFMLLGTPKFRSDNYEVVFTKSTYGSWSSAQLNDIIKQRALAANSQDAIDKKNRDTTRDYEERQRKEKFQQCMQTVRLVPCPY